MANRVALTGNDAVATALKQVNPDVAGVYPITPQTELMHKFASFIADGEVDTELVLVESEHSAMSVTVGAAAAGARAITATSSQGLALMWEVVYLAASLRLPIVMPEVNRSLSGPINIHCDHSDAMGCRDSGWIQLYSENSQEAYDGVFQAFRIAENRDVLLPVMVTMDGFIISHTVEALEMLDDEEAKKFVGEYEPRHWLLAPDKPITMGAFDLPPYYFEHKRQQVEAMQNALSVIEQVGQEYGELTGRAYGLIEEYKLEDADIAVVALGSTAGTAKVAVDELRERGVRAGLLKIRSFRPFPGRQIMRALSNVSVVGVLDRSLSFGLEGGPVFNEVRSAAFGTNNTGHGGNGRPSQIINFVYGLGGRDIGIEELSGIFGSLKKVKETGVIEKVVDYVGLRE